MDKAIRELERRATGAWQRYTAQKTPGHLRLKS